MTDFGTEPLPRPAEPTPDRAPAPSADPAPQAAPEPPAALPALVGQRLGGRVVPYWWLSGLVSTAVLAGILFAIFTALRGELRERRLQEVALWSGYGLLSLKLAWTIVAPPWSWRRWRWGIDSELLTLRWGIISHYERVIPISRLQHVDLTRGPIERLFGLTTLVVHTAGTSAASFDLPGLDDVVARALRDRILATRGNDVV